MMVNKYKIAKKLFQKKKKNWKEIQFIHSPFNSRQNRLKQVTEKVFEA